MTNQKVSSAKNVLTKKHARLVPKAIVLKTANAFSVSLILALCAMLFRVAATSVRSASIKTLSQVVASPATHHVKSALVKISAQSVILGSISLYILMTVNVSAIRT